MFNFLLLKVRLNKIILINHVLTNNGHVCIPWLCTSQSTLTTLSPLQHCESKKIHVIPILTEIIYDQSTKENLSLSIKYLLRKC